MIIRSNIHTHTTFCDGKNTPEEMVLAAIDAGLDTIGFSGHAAMPFDDGCGMYQEKTPLYKSEIRRLKDKYSGQIDILLGIEHELYCTDESDDYDYVIGSIHYLKKDGVYFPIDDGADLLISAVDKHYGGSYDDFARDYYSSLSSYIKNERPDVIGHFDVITKYSERNGIFADVSDIYREAVYSALDELIPLGIPFEVNTGPIGRGYKHEPYPAPWILRAIHDKGGEIIISSDAHSADTVAYAFDDAVRYSQNVGFTSVVCMGKNGMYGKSI